MVWARVVSHNGHQNIFRADQRPDHAARTFYPKTPQEIQKTHTAVTLKRSGWLIFLLAINPIIVILTIGFKSFLYSIPVSDGFGLVSLLSGVEKESLRLLGGAGLSGTLGDDVYVRFVVGNDEGTDNTVRARVRVLLEKVASSERSGKIDRKTVYS